MPSRSTRSAFALLLGAALLLPRPAMAAPETLALPEAPRIPLTLAYLGETLLHPGIMVGTESRLWESGWHAIIGANNLGAYQHAGNHSGIFLNGELGYRLTFPVGLSAEALAGAGVLYTVLPGDVYLPGQSEPSRDSGRPAFMPSASLGLGYALGDSRLFARLQAFGQYPYNTYTLMHLATQVGVTWNFR